MIQRARFLLTCCDRFGMFEGCVRRVSLGEDALILDAVSMECPPRLAYVEYSHKTRLIRFASKVFPVLQFTANVGSNPMNNAVDMELAVAAEFLNFLRKKGQFALVSGLDALAERWISEGGEFVPAQLEEFTL